MARFPGAKAIYEVADLFRERCLVAGQSLLWPDHRAWSVATVDALVGAFVGRADYGEGTFLDKLRDQLADEPDDVLRVAADVLAFYFLFPSSKSIGCTRKLESIRTIVGWRPESLAIAPSEWGLLEEAFVEGAGSTGSDYLTGRPAHLAFLLAFARGVINGQADSYDPDSCRRLIAALGPQLNGRTQARHVLLHLLFPDQFERTASEAHKTKMVAAFRDDAGGAADLDDALANIRKALTERLGRDDVDFYQPDLRPLWDTGPRPATIESEQVAAIRRALEAMYPDPAVRRICLTVFADSIKSAHGVSPASWSARFASDERALRLNVSWSQSCVLSQGDLYLVLDVDAVDAPTMEQIKAIAVEGHRSGAAYPSIPFAYGVHLPAAGLEKSLSIVLGAHRAFIARSAKQVRTRTQFFRAHAPEVIEYLRHELGRDLPQPDFGVLAPVAQQTWLFQANPAVWNLAEKLQNRSVGDDESWSVSRFREQMEPGQPVVLWMGGEDAGVYALGELVDAPFERRTADFWPDRGERGETEWAVPFVYTQILDQPITKSTLLAHPVLRDLSVIRGPMGTNFKVTPEQWRALQDLLGEQPDPLRDPTLDDLSARTYLDRAELEELEALLLDKRQLVLEGPPGSGKTFLAEHFARYFAGLPLQGAHDEQVETVQFHQSYGYEDFVQGIRPVTNEQGQLQYHVLPGIFMRMCDLAARNPDRRFVLIIDEINRGNLSRIFGELLLLLEYRDKQVRLPYGAVDGKEDQAYLSIPRNLYLIGTMNSTDRSLALIDYALRRRFYFYRLLPVVDGQAPVLDRWLTARGVNEQDRQRVVGLFVKLNREVEHHLGPEFQVGHSYFMRDDIGSDGGVQRLWRRSVMPLLEEYLHGARDRETVLTGLSPEQLLRESGPNEAPLAVTTDEP